MFLIQYFKKDFCMIFLILMNLIIILLLIFIIKKLLKNYYLTLLIVYLITININFFYLSQKFVENNLDNLWFNFATITFFITVYSWLYGVVTKSVSLKMLLFIKSKNSIKNLKSITKNIVKNEFDNRINIIKKLKFVTFRNNKYLLNKKGIKNINKIKKLRKIFFINKNSFYGKMK